MRKTRDAATGLGVRTDWAAMLSPGIRRAFWRIHAPRSLNRWIFPVAVLGKSVTNSTTCGY